jgi:polysaccharide export outer membrane protein
MNLSYTTASALLFLTFWAAASLQGQAGGPVAVGLPLENKAVENKAVENKRSESQTPAPPVQPPPAPPTNAGVAPAAAAQDVPTSPAPKPTPRKGKQPPPQSTPPQSGEEKPYVIGSLDILEVKVWNDQKLSGMVDVRPDGIVNMPLIGEMRADGLTVMELTKLIKTRLVAADFMEDPEVTIQVVRINSKKYYIMGGCLRQGEFPLVAATTVFDAFANCGGFKDFANLKKIYVLRGSTQLPFNYKDVSRGRHMEQNIRLQNGDRIIIPE